MNNPIEVAGGGIKCDNPSCDYVNESVKIEDYDQWLNKPCPKCGENLLTEEDYAMVICLLGIVGSDFIQNLDIPTDPDEPQVEMRVDVHNKKIEIKPNTDNAKE